MVGILLAAGFSRRFGSADKLLQPLPDGRPIALVSAVNLVQAIPNSIAVLRPDNQVLAKLLVDAGLKVVFCAEHDQKMADSLATAVRFSADHDGAQEGFVIALADMPLIRPTTISQVVDQLKGKGDGGYSIVIPTFDSHRGHPVGFSAQFKTALENLRGDEGARSIIQQHPNVITLMPTNDSGILADIDTPADMPMSV